MVYMKHPTLGNQYFWDAEQSEREAQGWVRWPRTKEQKAGLAAPQDGGSVSPQPSLSPATPVGAAPIKRKPGRPRKS